jgi:acyl-CoA thioester hydrolase
VEKRRSATVRMIVPFCDADPMQVVWHGNYLKYFDAARDRLFCDAGIDLYGSYQGTGMVFPIIRTQTKHIWPLRVRDEVDITATLIEFECRLVFDFEVRNVQTGKLCVKGRSEQAAVRMADWTLELRMPDFIRNALATPPKS